MQRLTTIPLLVSLVFLVLAPAADAGVPGPERAGCFPNQNPCWARSSFHVTGQGAACQFRFRADGGRDRLTLTVTLRDAFDVPTVGCSTSATVRSTAGTLALCSCCPLRQTGLSNEAGRLQFVYSSLGGRGTLRISVTAHCSGNISMYEDEFQFTSTDLDGSCEGSRSTTVLDLGSWAHCLPPSPYCVPADFDCSGSVNIIDLGFWAGGLTLGCDDEVCP